MAGFEDAFAMVVGLEGGWNDYADDEETIFGVNRKWNPDWPGWALVDAMKGSEYFPACANESAEILEMAKTLYRKEYWDKVRGDDIPHDDVATKLLDVAVHRGVRTAGRFLQEALNLLRRPQESPYFVWLNEDGLIGRLTLRAYGSLIEHDGIEGSRALLMCLLRTFQGQLYVELARSYPSDSRRLRGYLSRV